MERITLFPRKLLQKLKNNFKLDLPNPKSILVVQIGKIGDMILTTPLFSELKKLFPRSELIILASEINKDIPLNHNSVDKVVVFRKSLIKNLALIQLLFKKIDVWIDTKDNYSNTSSLLVKILKPKISLGYEFNNKIFKVSLNEYLMGKHAIDINLSPINYFQKRKDKSNIKPSYNIPEAIVNKFDSVFKNNGKKNILINISAGSPSRYLDKEKWYNVIAEITSQGNFAFKLIGLEKDKEIINFLMKSLSDLDINYIHTENIIETSAVVNKSDFIITADTSIVHICSAFDKPVIALFPGVKWNLNKFAPLSEYSEIILAENKNSIADLMPEEIVQGFFRLVEKINSGNAESRTRVRKEDH